MLQLKSIEQDTYKLLQELSKLDYTNNFALAGGSSLALQLGHRISIDLDFFTLLAFDSTKLLDKLNSIYKISNVSVSDNSLSLYINMTSSSRDGGNQNIKVEFIRHNYKLIKEYIKEESIRLYAMEDICAMKLNAIANRGSKKDFYDIYELFKIFPVSDMLEFYKEKYKSRNVFTVVKSLNYFDDADLEPSPMSLNSISWQEIKDKIVFELNKII